MNKPKLNITRYKLYSIIKGQTEKDSLMDMLLDFLLTLLENVEEYFIENTNKKRSSTFKDIVSSNIERALGRMPIADFKNTKRLPNYYRNPLFNLLKMINDLEDSELLNKLMNYVTLISEKSFNPNDYKLTDDYKNNIDHSNQVFLSYAHDDQLLTLGYYLLFKMHGVFLYIDWMNNDIIDDGHLLKKTLNKAMKDSKQLLFLRSLNSELDLQGKSSVRQWCSWEIGNYYCISPKNKFYTAMYNLDIYSKGKLNAMLSTFNPLKKIDINGMS